MKKSTAIAPSNIAFIKYWGKKDEILRLPENASISMVLSDLTTTTTVEFDKKLKKDDITIDGERNEKSADKVTKHLNRIRKIAKISDSARVVSNNNFPSSTGLSSSASGFAALTVSAAAAAGLKLSEKELSILARQGSGSACRSIPDGIVEWLDGNTSDTSYAISLYKPQYWDIADVVVVVSDEKKLVPTTEGQKSAAANPFMKTRLDNIGKKIAAIKKTIKERDFEKFGEILEMEALELHSIMLTSNPPLLYWLPNTVMIMRYAQRLRREGLPVYFTVNTGQDVHLIVEKKNAKRLIAEIKKLKGVKKIIVNSPSEGTRLSPKHLF
jgi:diphosphomevalonate decarboxylase